MAGQDSLAEHRRTSYELWQRMAEPWRRRRELAWRWTRPVSEWLVEKLDPRPGQTLLELAAATGETGFLAAARLGEDGRLISSDFSPEMVCTAERVGSELGVRNAEYRLLDAERIDLDDRSVDGVICRFSCMLVADPLQAFRETQRVLRPGGRVALSTWGEAGRNPWMTFSGRLMIERGLMEPFSSDGPGVFALPDAETIVPLLTGAGFGQVEVEEMGLGFRFEDADELWIFASELQGPVALAIAKLDDGERHDLRVAIEERASEFAVDGGYELLGCPSTSSRPELPMPVAAGSAGRDSFRREA